MKHSEIKARNPLYRSLKEAPYFIPRYDELRPSDFVPALQVAIFEANLALEQIRKNPEPASFNNTILAFEDACEVVRYFHRTFSHLILSNRTPDMEAAEAPINKSVASFWHGVYLDRDLFRRIAGVEREKIFLPHEDRVLTDKIYKDFIDRGAALPLKKRARVAAIDQVMVDLQTAYAQAHKIYIQDSIRVIKDHALLKGVSEKRIVAAKQEAIKRNIPNAWVITGDTATWVEWVLTAESSRLRRMLYKPDETDALDTIVEQMLILRHERAGLFGYASPFHYKNRGSMVETPEALRSFLDHFRDCANPTIRIENRQLAQFARQQGLRRLERHDRYYMEEKLKQERLGFNDESLKPYLNVVRVQQTVLEVLGNLFDVTFFPAPHLPVSHPDITMFEVYDRNTAECYGCLSLDLFGRSTKNEGAWCEAGSSHGRFQGQIALPFLNVACNFDRAEGDAHRSSLTLCDVATLFHEMGHAIHALLGKTKHQSLSGFNNVGADIVELPSQFLENFAYQPSVINRYARHEQTGATLSQEAVQNIQHSRSFRGANNMRYALEYTYLDLILHTERPGALSLGEREVKRLAELFPGRSKAYVIAPIFQHLAVHGYDATYHGYFWSENLEAHVFKATDPDQPSHLEKMRALRDIYQSACLRSPRELLAPFIEENEPSMPLIDRYGLLGWPSEFNRVAQLDILPIATSSNDDYLLGQSIAHVAAPRP